LIIANMPRGMPIAPCGETIRLESTDLSIIKYSGALARLPALSEEHQPHHAPLACRAVHPAHADLRIHRLLVGLAALPAAQPGAGLAALRGRRSEDHRAVRADPVSLHLEVPLVAAARPLRAAARPAARLDADHAGRPAAVDRGARAVRAGQRDRADPLADGGGGAALGDAGHRARRLPPRDPVRVRAGPRQLGARQCLSHRRPGARLAVADPGRPPALAAGLRHHRAVHAAGHGAGAAGARAGGGGQRAEDPAPGGGRTLPRVHRDAPARARR
jgi:hypothetical protein